MKKFFYLHFNQSLFLLPMRMVIPLPAACCLLLLPPLLFSQPKLVVGIVVDQMRYDYLERYEKKFGKDGFRRLMKSGFSCKNANFSFVPTFTAPGHASIYTGAPPSVHGIAGNEWFDRNTKKTLYCTADTTVLTVGAEGSAGQMSPKNLFSSTMTDELRKAKNNAAKVISIALKDRGAILPGGRNPTAAYWYDSRSGNWITSTYYRKELPDWVKKFNEKELAKKYLSQKWVTLLPVEKYTESGADDSHCEFPFRGKDRSVFPYNLPALMEHSGLDLLRSTPFGNSFTLDFAMEAIQKEELGKDTITDFLCISLSSPDYIGHQFGPQSVEVQDCYLRLDKDIAAFLKFLNKHVGKNNYMLFLTSDHGASEAVPCLEARDIPAGFFSEKQLADSLKQFFRKTYRDSALLAAISDFNIYLDRQKMEKKKLKPEDVQKKTAEFVRRQKAVADALPAAEIREKVFTDSIRAKVKSGFHSQRSGDVVFVLMPHYLPDYFVKGTTHGSPYRYDTHVPLIFYGWKIKSGSMQEPVDIQDIATTVCTLLNIPAPEGATGKPLMLPMKK